METVTLKRPTAMCPKNCFWNWHTLNPKKKLGAKATKHQTAGLQDDDKADTCLQWNPANLEPTNDRWQQLVSFELIDLELTMKQHTWIPTSTKTKLRRPSQCRATQNDR